MKKLILIGVIGVVAAAVYAVGFVNYSQSLTEQALDNDTVTIVGTQIILNPDTDPVGTPKYKALMTYTVVSPADTSSVAIDSLGQIDSANVHLYGWWNGAKYPIYSFTTKADLPDTFAVTLADTGNMKQIFYYDAFSIDVVCTDSCGSGDTLNWAASHKVKLIER